MTSTPDPDETVSEADAPALAVDDAPSDAEPGTVSDADPVTEPAFAEPADDPAAEEVDAVREADERLLAAHDLALAALKEVTPETSIGAPAGHRVEADGVVSLLFANRMAGYPGWFWTVSLARVEDAEPTVLEVELLPGDGALLAPDWVPWAVRLADYQAAQAALADAGDDDDSDAELDDVDDLDASDFDDDGSPILHGGDVDGVDIDELDASLDTHHDSDDDAAEDDSDDDESIDDESNDDDDDDEDDGFDDDDSDEDDASDEFFDDDEDDSADDDEDDAAASTRLDGDHPDESE
ncbi:hypothetical protein JOD63_000665 [Microbacterium terrae]|uniref:DUF3027 domain-containing protein n=1 Tax=Microbacterium terrae TaxID=69369 RepID=A0A0M2HD24_9MICO|nr:DUF3027 domain-containing protein [Microbacterium terrae]KJL42040.1 hypothetical protein RS81_01196 [Microbacterium terrae]MBP1076697.1 hypothetical protein [Microbacterium terrae]GLJ97525.1 hypothetical protein GCM10017594_07220 [Microbacterium terrae]